MKIFICSMMVCMCLVFSTSAFALTMSDVGGPDVLLYQTYYTPTTQEVEMTVFSDAFVQNQIDVDMSDWHLRTYDFKQDGYDGWYQITDSPSGTDYWAFDFGNLQKEYFLINTGAVKSPDGTKYNYFVFENTGSLQYGVIDLAMFGSTGIKLDKISHLTVPNPEPSTLLLLGAGIFGLALYRRKKY